MGNILRLFIKREEEDHGEYYLPISRPQHYGGGDQLAAAPRLQPRPRQQIPLTGNRLLCRLPSAVVAAHGPAERLVQHSGDGRLTAEDLNPLTDPPVINLAGGPSIGNLQKSSENEAPAARICRCNNTTKEKDIDESSAEGLRDAISYAKAHAMLVQVPVLGTTKKFWRLSDRATRISRKLALILRSHHSVGKCLAAPLQVPHVWVSSDGSVVKLRGVSFTGNRFCIERVRDDYRHLSVVLLLLVRGSGGDVTKLPPDYMQFLTLLRRDTLTTQDEFLIVNHPALLPMKNRTEVFLMLCDKINKCLGRTRAGQAKRRRILSKLPYEKDWLDTATANTLINQWVANVHQHHQYERTQYDQLRLHRNVRSHMHDYNDDDIEEVLYCEWPELLMEMVNLLHLEGELQGTDIQNKFGG